jgi:hypothetical protein
LQRDGPRLHCYPNGLYVIQYLGINKRNRVAVLARKLGRWTEDAAQDALAKFIERQAKPASNLPAVIPRPRGRPPGNGHAVATARVRNPDVSKAVLGLVATHLLNTLAHTVKLLQDADADGE